MIWVKSRIWIFSTDAQTDQQTDKPSAWLINLIVYTLSPEVNNKYGYEKLTKIFLGTEVLGHILVPYVLFNFLSWKKYNYYTTIKMNFRLGLVQQSFAFFVYSR